MISSPPNELHDKLADLVGRIRSVVDPIRIVLFGSHARGDAGEHSDLDVLVVVPDGTHRRHTQQDLYMQLRGFGLPVDFVVATPSDLERYKDCQPCVISPALKEGVEVYAA
jgi:predicted nucleotidyltransferase